MSLDKIIDRIKKLQRLATSSNPNEAAAAAAEAQRLMLEHRVEAASLEDVTQPKEKIGEHDVMANASEAWIGALAQGVSYAYDCKIFWRGSKLHAIGRPSDVAALRYMLAYLGQEVVRLSEAHSFDDDPDYAFRSGAKRAGYVRTWRSQFRVGCATTIAARLREGKGKFEQEVKSRTDAATCTALVRLADVKTEVQAYVKAHYKFSSRGGSSARYNSGARAAGAAAGHGVNLSGGKAQLGAPATQIGRR